MTCRILNGDSRFVLSILPSNSFDSVVTDPPYELTNSNRRKPPPIVDGSPFSRHRVGVNGDNRASRGFMGQEWDGSGIAHDVGFWREVLRVLKPGGYLLAFGGTRTYHRLGVAIEDAGFEIRDMVSWMFGQGFPKSLNCGDGLGTALKPAQEPVCMARKPLIGTVEKNLREYGVGAINIDACRVGYEDTPNPATNPLYRTRHGYAVKVGSDSAGSSWTIKPEGGEVTANPLGRWPANLIHDGSTEVVALFPDSAGQLAYVGPEHGARDSINVYGDYGARPPCSPRNDSGSAARFFYQAKASKSDRGEGNTHPTVKPITLMRYLCKLVTPKGGHILDPFGGSGTTGVAAEAEGFNSTLIEMSPDYVETARKRIGPEHCVLK